MNAFTIRDLENLSGIKAHTIRIWEKRHDFLKPKRSGTNIRYYSSDELKTLLNYALLNKNGYKISSIAEMTPDTISEKVLSLTSFEAQHERMINSLLNAMVELNAQLFEQVVNNYIRDYGTEQSVKHLLFPFLQRIGILWMTDHIRVAQEHFVSNIIRQKLIKGIEEIDIHGGNGSTVVLFLPEGEYHELGLLYVYYLLKIKGINTIYLGADVPVEELEYVCKMKHPRYLYTHLTALPARFNFEKYLSLVTPLIGNSLLMISGNITHHYQKKIPGGIVFLKSLDEVIEQLAA
jgi:MerR family transcriptional regulator, light-induced transcriptional regulator